MRIAFYAPMKPVDHPIVSGDREIARLLVQTLQLAGHKVEIPTRLRSWVGRGQQQRQRQIRTLAVETANALVKRYQQHQNRPQLWFTYHCYHKAPDWIGPIVAQSLQIPYLIAEASYAPKQIDGEWAMGHEQTFAAIQQSAGIVFLNRQDVTCVQNILPPTAKTIQLNLFIDFDVIDGISPLPRERLAQIYKLDATKPWLVTAAMMRPGDKLQSYLYLADALSKLRDTPWQMLIAGDGSCRSKVQQAFAQFDSGQIRFLNRLDKQSLIQVYKCSDIFVWPAVNEALGMSILEAQASGLAVVSGNAGGIPDIITDEKTGLLCHSKDSVSFARHIRTLLTNVERRKTMADAARTKIQSLHDVWYCARQLDEFINTLSKQFHD